MIFGLIQVGKIQREIRIQVVLCMKVNHMKCQIFRNLLYLTAWRVPRFAFLSVSGVNVDFDDKINVVECFQKFTNEDMRQLFVEQTYMCQQIFGSKSQFETTIPS